MRGNNCWRYWDSNLRRTNTWPQCMPREVCWNQSCFLIVLRFVLDISPSVTSRWKLRRKIIPLICRFNSLPSVDQENFHFFQRRSRKTSFWINISKSYFQRLEIKLLIVFSYFFWSGVTFGKKAARMRFRNFQTRRRRNLASNQSGINQSYFCDGITFSTFCDLHESKKKFLIDCNFGLNATQCATLMSLITFWRFLLKIKIRLNDF